MGEALGFLCACDFEKISEGRGWATPGLLMPPLSPARLGPIATELRRLRCSGAVDSHAFVTEVDEESGAPGPPDRESPSARAK